MEMVQVPQVRRSAAQLVQSSYYAVGTSDQEISNGQSRVHEAPKLSFKSESKHGFKIYKIKKKARKPKKSEKQRVDQEEPPSVDQPEDSRPAVDDSRCAETEHAPRLSTLSQRSEPEEHKLQLTHR